MSLFINEGGNTLVLPTAAVVAPASGTNFFTWASGLPLSVGVVQNQTGPFPENFVLSDPFSIRTSTGGLQAGDTWGPMYVFVEEWIDI